MIATVTIIVYISDEWYEEVINKSIDKFLIATNSTKYN